MLMRSLVGQLVVQLLAALLVLTTPIGTGEGVHQSELLHPVLPHVHTINGHIVSDQQLAMDRTTESEAAANSEPTGGAALGAGSGADAAGLGIALGPTLPAIHTVVASSATSRVPIVDSATPPEFRSEPLDPPPDQIA
ncbi:MAG TPA: hypothetical protein VGJ60_21820 [Chloroflexota bacterium]